MKSISTFFRKFNFLHNLKNRGDIFDIFLGKVYKISYLKAIQFSHKMFGQDFLFYYGAGHLPICVILLCKMGRSGIVSFVL